MTSQLPKTTPEQHLLALRIAKMGRIVIQAFLPPELIQETERRLYLIAVGEMQQGRESRRDAL